MKHTKQVIVVFSAGTKVRLVSCTQNLRRHSLFPCKYKVSLLKYCTHDNILDTQIKLQFWDKIGTRREQSLFPNYCLLISL